MTTYVWTITQMLTLPDVQGNIDFVWNAFWKCEATLGNKTTAMASSVILDPESTGTPYTPYEDLTEDQVVQWVKDKLGAATVAKVEAQLNAELNTIILPLPWA